MKNNACRLYKSLFLAGVLVLMLNTACLAYNAEAIEAYNKGIELTNREDYEKAIEKFEKAVKTDPEFIDAYYNLGILQEYLGENEKALESFEKVLKYNPEDYETAYKLATIHYTLGNLEEAETFMEKIPPEDSNFKKLVEFMSDSKANVHNINHDDNEDEKNNENDDNNEDLTYKQNGPDFCESDEHIVSGLESPTGIVKDSMGNLYIANFSNDTIIYIDQNGKEQIIAKKGLIKGPMGLAVDKYDNLYVANYESDEIVLLPASGEPPHVLPVKVQKPYFLMIDNAGILYVSEQGKNSVSKHRLIWNK